MARRYTEEEIQELRQSLQDPRMQAFLDMTARAEGTIREGSDNGYNVHFGGDLFHDYDRHPMRRQTAGGTPTYAAGRYQINKVTYEDFAPRLGITDFSPESQDLIAAAIIKSSGQLGNVLNGRLHEAVNGLGGRWASFPSAKGSPRSWQYVTGQYNRALEERSNGQVAPAQMPAALSRQASTQPQQSSNTPVDTLPAPPAIQPPVVGRDLQALIRQQRSVPRLAISTDRLTPEVAAASMNALVNPQQGDPVIPYPTAHYDSPSNIAVVSSPVGVHFSNNVPIATTPIQPGQTPVSTGPYTRENPAPGSPERYIPGTEGYIQQGPTSPLQIEGPPVVSVPLTAEAGLPSDLGPAMGWQPAGSTLLAGVPTDVVETINADIAAIQQARIQAAEAQQQARIDNLMAQLQDTRSNTGASMLFGRYPSTHDAQLLAAINNTTVSPIVG